jgi:hypothetical protein
MSQKCQRQKSPSTKSHDVIGLRVNLAAPGFLATSETPCKAGSVPRAMNTAHRYRSTRMNKRVWFGSMASLVVLTMMSGSAAAQQPKMPNIVVMLADNLGYGELGVYGGGILPVQRPRASTLLPVKVCACSTSMSRRNARRLGRLS